jgi:hypothetical protein
LLGGEVIVIEQLAALLNFATLKLHAAGLLNNGIFFAASVGLCI